MESTRFRIENHLQAETRDKGILMYRRNYARMEALSSGNTRKAMDILKRYYSEIPYTLIDKEKEKSYQLLFFAFFVGIGAGIIAEEATAMGRSDVVIKTRDNVYIVELKVDDTPDNAISQIREKGCHEKYMKKNKKIHLIGIESHLQIGKSLIGRKR